MRKYQLDFTLRRLAAIAVSKHLLKYSKLKDLLRSHIEEDSSAEDLPVAVMKLIEHFDLPKPAKEELMFAVGAMGCEIWELLEELDWACYPPSAEDVQSILPEPSRYLDHICWTDHGCIDLSETIRLLYNSRILPQNHAMWIEHLLPRRLHH